MHEIGTNLFVESGKQLGDVRKRIGREKRKRDTRFVYY